MSAAGDPEVSDRSTLPPGYIFVLKGTPYVTKHCRSKTYDVGKTVYVVKNRKGNTIGIRVPQDVFHQVVKDELQTRNNRRDAVQKKDDSDKQKFEEEVLKVYPQIPREVVPVIVNWTLKKRSGRVGRTMTMSQSDKVRLAANAHVRHTHTHYDKLLKDGLSRDQARKAVQPDQRRKLNEWRGVLTHARTTRDTQTKKRNKKEDKVDKVAKKQRAVKAGKGTKSTKTKPMKKAATAVSSTAKVPVAARTPSSAERREAKAATRWAPVSSEPPDPPLATEPRRSVYALRTRKISREMPEPEYTSGFEDGDSDDFLESDFDDYDLD
ncbi:hypothetical protein MKZ38_002800 [Zalerion maritima]|uniref:DUF2293 domain-containing protein n=1 Tax=Zalerion maritima TaxID=339359 RepID=A0AAD5WS53_9PEZI|nr:hypothetical protein MKZ38_002800 [Zalerion maritima]